MTKRTTSARHQGESRLRSPMRCACGRSLDAGWTATTPRNNRTQCLICETAASMQTFVYPPRKERSHETH